MPRKLARLLGIKKQQQQEPIVLFKAVSNRDTPNIKILIYLNFPQDIASFITNGKMSLYQCYPNILKQTIT